MPKIRKNHRAISEKNAKLPDGQMGQKTDRQAENSDFIGPSVGLGSKKGSASF